MSQTVETVECKMCKGRGERQFEYTDLGQVIAGFDPCKWCGGTGRVPAPAPAPVEEVK